MNDRMGFCDCISIAFGCRDVSRRPLYEPMLRQSKIQQSIFQKTTSKRFRAVPGGCTCPDWTALKKMGAQWEESHDTVHR